MGAGAARVMSGLAYLEAMINGEAPRAPIGELMGFDGVSVEEGRVVVEVEPAEYHYNTVGKVHGGLAATLLDTVTGCAVHSVLPAGTGYATLDLKVTFLRPITVATGRMSCEGKTIHVGGRIATAEGRLTDAEGRLYAHATSTCVLLRPRAAPAAGEGRSGDRLNGDGTT